MPFFSPEGNLLKHLADFLLCLIGQNLVPWPLQTGTGYGEWVGWDCLGHSRLSPVGSVLLPPPKSDFSWPEERPMPTGETMLGEVLACFWNLEMIRLLICAFF